MAQNVQEDLNALRNKKKSPFWVYFVYISVNIENN